MIWPPLDKKWHPRLLEMEWVIHAHTWFVVAVSSHLGIPVWILHHRGYGLAHSAERGGSDIIRCSIVRYNPIQGRIVVRSLLGHWPSRGGISGTGGSSSSGSEPAEFSESGSEKLASCSVVKSGSSPVLDQMAHSHKFVSL